MSDSYCSNPFLEYEDKTTESNHDPAGLEKTLQFLIEQSMESSKQFWTRMNIFLAINTVFLGFILKMIHNSSDWSLESSLIGLLASIVGIFITHNWINSINITDYYLQRWLTDARRVAMLDKSGTLINRYLYSLGFREAYANESVLNPLVTDHPYTNSEKFNDVTRPTRISSTKRIKNITYLFYTIWVLLSIYLLQVFIREMVCPLCQVITHITS